MNYSFDCLMEDFSSNCESIAHFSSLSSGARAQFIDFARGLNIIIIKNENLSNI